MMTMRMIMIITKWQLAREKRVCVIEGRSHGGLVYLFFLMRFRKNNKKIRKEFLSLSGRGN